LGGGQKQSFKAKAKNKGTVPVTLLLLSTDGVETPLLVLAPGREATANAPAQSALLVRNETDTEAVIYVTSRDKMGGLNMYYKKEAEYKK
jgi:hypothetical protein